MPKKTATHAGERNSATARGSQHGARVSRHQTNHMPHSPARAITAPARMLAPGDLLALQRAAGNRAVEQMLAQTVRHQQPSRLTIQTKLEVGSADDPYEREADRVAANVIQTYESSSPHIQRQPVPEEDEAEMLQKEPPASTITPIPRRRGSPERNEEEPLIPRRAGGGTASVESEVELSIERARGAGQPLPEDLRNRMEQSFGADFSAVRVNADAQSDNLNRALRSRAFTAGQDLFFKRGEYDPASHTGRQVIAHELAHVVQQTGSVSRGKESTNPRAMAGKVKRHDSPGAVRLRTTSVGRLVQLLSLKQENEVKRMSSAFEIKGLKFDTQDDEYRESNYQVIYKLLSDKGWNTDEKNIEHAYDIITEETGLSLFIKAPAKEKKEAEAKYEISSMKRGEFAKAIMGLGCKYQGKDGQNHAIYLNPATKKTTSLGIGGHGDNATQDESVLKTYLKQLEITPEEWNKA